MTAPHGSATAELPPLVCPRCRELLTEVTRSERRCPRDGFVAERREGIWRLLDSADQQALQQSIERYAESRRLEGWGSADPGYYRALPRVGPSDPHREVWRIRARSYRRLERLLQRRRAAVGSRAALDLGAGNGWLSHRLAGLGWTPVALDRSDDDRDGLGAHPVYGAPPPFLPVLATFERVPFADRSFALVVFNGSLHYAVDLAVVLAEGQRVLATDGLLVVMDSPFFGREADGRTMLAERHPDDGGGAGCPIAGFLTGERIHRATAGLDLRWRRHRIPMGWRWQAGNLRRRLLGGRQRAGFPIWIGTRGR